MLYSLLSFTLSFTSIFTSVFFHFSFFLALKKENTKKNQIAENTKKRSLVLLKCKTTFLPPKGLNFIWGLSLRPGNNTAGIPYALNCCQRSQVREEIPIVAESCDIYYRTVNFAGSAGMIQDDLAGDPYINGKLWMSIFQRILRFVISPFLERVMAGWMQAGQGTRQPTSPINLEWSRKNQQASPISMESSGCLLSRGVYGSSFRHSWRELWQFECRQVRIRAKLQCAFSMCFMTLQRAFLHWGAY